MPLGCNSLIAYSTNSMELTLYALGLLILSDLYMEGSRAPNEAKVLKASVRLYLGTFFSVPTLLYFVLTDALLSIHRTRSTSIKVIKGSNYRTKLFMYVHVPCEASSL